MPDSAGLEALFIRLYLDRHIMTRLAVDLRGRGYDVLTTEEAGKDTASDEEQLAFATAENRAVLTFNIRDFAPLHEAWQAAKRPHAGIIVSTASYFRGCCACSTASRRKKCSGTLSTWNNSSSSPALALLAQVVWPA